MGDDAAPWWCGKDKRERYCQTREGRREKSRPRSSGARQSTANIRTVSKAPTVGVPKACAGYCSKAGGGRKSRTSGLFGRVRFLTPFTARGDGVFSPSARTIAAKERPSVLTVSRLCIGAISRRRWAGVLDIMIHGHRKCSTSFSTAQAAKHNHQRCALAEESIFYPK